MAAAASPTKAPAAIPATAPVIPPAKAPVVPTKAPVQNDVGTVNLTLVTLIWGGNRTALVNEGVMEYNLYDPHTVLAEFVDSALQSVKFTYDGNAVRVENEPPYVLAGKKGTGWLPWIPTPGRHTLVVTAYNQKDGSGVVVAASTISFTAALKVDVTQPKILKIRPSIERVYSRPTPSTLEISIMARDERSGIARITAAVSTFVWTGNTTGNTYVDHSNVPVRFNNTMVASTKGKPFFYNVSLPYHINLPAGDYTYRVEVEDGAGKIANISVAYFYYGEYTDQRLLLYVDEQQIELLNVTTQPTINPTVTMNTSGLPAQVPVKITLRDDTNKEVCILAVGNGFHTNWWGPRIEHCIYYPINRTLGRPFDMNFILEMPRNCPSGIYGITLSWGDYSLDAAYLASKNFASTISLVNPNIKPLSPPVIRGLVALSPTTLDRSALERRKEANVTVRLVVEDVVSGFDGDIQFWLDGWRVAQVSTKDSPLVAGQSRSFDVDLRIFAYKRPGLYPLSLVFRDKFDNVANVSSASLALQGFPLVVKVLLQGSISGPRDKLQGLSFADDSLARADLSFGYRRVVVSYGFGLDPDASPYIVVQQYSMNLTATGASDSNRGVVLQAINDCHPRYSSTSSFYSCFFLNEDTPLGLYLLTADVNRGEIYNSTDLAPSRQSNFTVTSYITTGLGP